MIHLVLLSGGSGTRLWPLSNNARSKQFLKVLRDEEGNHVSMVQRVFAQIGRVPAALDVTIATCETQAQSIEAQVSGEYALVLEPQRRDTAPAIMLACAHLALEQGAAAEDTVVVMPIDTYASQDYYDRIPQLDAAVQAGAAELVLLGVQPTYAAEKYGYIVPAAGAEVPEASDPPLPVARFTEKPDAATAAKLIERGALWNCGVFAFRLGWLTAITAGYAQAESFEQLRGRYAELPKNSFDYEVVERAGSVAVIPYAGEWKDLGTWNTLSEEMAQPYSGRAVVDEATCSNVHVINETGLPLVVAGLSDSVVVASYDGILVSGKEASSNIKAVVARAAETRPMYERRRWGEYRVLDMRVYEGGTRQLTKELVIEAGRQISYQRHAHRSEVWTVVAGTGQAALDGQVLDLAPGSVVAIEPQRMHAVRAEGELHIIEVQLGDTLAEEDIERFGNFWGEQGRRQL